ncbi:lytic murein transglycosylase [Mariprofundus erugo]|uniref:Lytic murein transglycosylase n=1 Tax=Mariprofundus erugo TaxID=2528639 RepID=A0A5R9GX09_9PROT|nr:lytic murein transglycosylase [Mariprofundus erugo]TLS67614.1 lytic murein transglycosylase [Mariprofundus erugo]
MQLLQAPCPADSEQPIANPLRRTLLRGAGFAAITLCLPSPLVAAAIKHPHQQVDRETLIRLVAAETGLPVSYVASMLGHATFTPAIIRQITTPYESRSYAEYRPLFLGHSMEKMGRDYLHQQQQHFAAVEERYRVDKEIIAAILGMETRYGRHRGKDRIVDSLYTLATGFPRRANFFRKELGEFLLLAREEHLDATQQLGSYAGAFGTTQFIPSSYRAYAVDADGDGHRNVWDSPADIIASVGNYFHLHGWQQGRPCAHWLPVIPQLQAHAEAGFDQWVTLASLRRQLPALPPQWQDDDKVTLIDMQPPQGRRFALVHYNFYVTTRWNRSYNYAMAATEVAAMLGGQSFAVT